MEVEQMVGEGMEEVAEKVVVVQVKQRVVVVRAAVVKAAGTVAVAKVAPRVVVVMADWTVERLDVAMVAAMVVDAWVDLRAGRRAALMVEM
jgi:hypothetical protein